MLELICRLLHIRPVNCTINITSNHTLHKNVIGNKLSICWVPLSVKLADIYAHYEAFLSSKVKYVPKTKST